MTQAAAQATAFYQEVARNGNVWTIKDAFGIPAPASADGRAMPFWSSLARAERVVKTVPAYAGFRPLELSLDTFRDVWLQGLERDGLNVGLNWTGPQATGYDLSAKDVRVNIAAALDRAMSD
jgi:hypothetical protein